MSRHKAARTRTQRMERRAARLKIIAAAEKARGWSSKPFTMRTLQQAVCVVRRRRLVKDPVLITAGFGPRRAPEGHPLKGIPQGRRASGSPLSPPGGDRTAVEMSGQPPRARGRRARRRASAATDPQARERAPLATSVRTRRAKSRAGAAGPASGPRPGDLSQ